MTNKPHVQKTIHCEPYRRLLQRLKTARKAARLTQAQAGRKLGHTGNWLHKIEIAETRMDVLQMVHLCRLYHVKPADLLRSVEESSSDDSFYLSWLLVSGLRHVCAAVGLLDCCDQGGGSELGSGIFVRVDCA